MCLCLPVPPASAFCDSSLSYLSLRRRFWSVVKQADHIGCARGLAERKLGWISNILGFSGLPRGTAVMGRKKIQITRIMDERNRQVGVS